jgi:glycosyltransferase involved in cell wall biosynthesis
MQIVIALISGMFLVFFYGYFFMISRAARSFPELHSDSHSQTDADFPKISFILAVKDEEGHVEDCVRSLFSLSYPDFELVVVNDRSSDATESILDKLQKEFSSRLIVKTIDNLPDGWGGQNHAFWNGVLVANGDWFCFTDADCRFDSSNVLEQAYLEARLHDVSFLSMLPRMDLPSVVEKIYVPICSFLFLQGLDYSQSNNPRSASASAYGPFMLMSRDSYYKLGGHHRVRYLVNGDIAFARIAKAEGIAYRLVGNRGLCRTHMYLRLRDSWSGWVRNYYNSIQNSARLLYTCALAIAFVMPLPLLGASLYFGDLAAVLLSGALVVTLVLALSRLYSAFDVSSMWSLVYLPGAIWSAAIACGALYKAILHQHTPWHGVDYPPPCRIPPRD